MDSKPTTIIIAKQKKTVDTKQSTIQQQRLIKKTPSNSSPAAKENTIFRLRTGHNRLKQNLYNKLNLEIGISERFPCGFWVQTTEHSLSSAAFTRHCSGGRRCDRHNSQWLETLRRSGDPQVTANFYEDLGTRRSLLIFTKTWGPVAHR
ncbi:hypothetical protein ElyMa_003081500 [Elysia marginata]|uniref:Uncharacterized protein n=1 Tax=Elysia marginata TaxID=1093978 RepID=A0AAV4ILM4_9GAST|nr:hypothetical protein ElyMa_003081500 [Elysia marginata]